MTAYLKLQGKLNQSLYFVSLSCILMKELSALLPAAHAPLIDFLGSNEGPNDIDITLLEAKLFEMASLIGALNQNSSINTSTHPLLFLDCFALQFCTSSVHPHLAQSSTVQTYFAFLDCVKSALNRTALN